MQNILAKQLGSNNTLNNARAVLNGLTQLRTFSEAAKDRGVPIESLYST